MKILPCFYFNDIRPEYAFANSPEQKKAELQATIGQIQQDFVVLPLTPPEAKIFVN